MFATSKPGVERISLALAAPGESGTKGEMPLFQALIRVRLEKGYQVLEADLITVHKFRSQNPSRAGGANPTTSAP
jgi:hypothetical protein